MTLGFSQKINGKPNGFVEKILVGLYKSQIIPISKLCELCREPGHPMPVDYYYIDSARAVIDGVHPKLHTIREDKHQRWRAGMDIHPVINNRTPNRFQFAPVMKCISTQHLIIKWFKSDKIVETRRHLYNPVEGLYAYIMIDCKNYPLHINQDLFTNDGFNGIEDFFAYFNKDFTGKIIHWTNLKY